MAFFFVVTTFFYKTICIFQKISLPLHRIMNSDFKVLGSHNYPFLAFFLVLFKE